MGGATNSMLFTIQNLPKDKYASRVLFLDKEGPASELFRANNVEIDHLQGVTHFQHAENGKITWIGRKPLKPVFQFIQMLNSVKIIYDYLINQKIDLVHINTSVMLAVGIACYRIKLKVVWHVREPIARGVLGIRKFIVSRIIHKCANEIIAISNQDLKALGNPPNGNVIYNFVNFQKFNSETVKGNLHTELNLPIDTKIILMLGGIVHSKGADVIVESMPDVLNSNAQVHYVIAGYPPNQNNTNFKFRFWRNSLSKKCLKLISDNNLVKHITFIGLRNDVPELLASSYLLVWPATVEHFSRPVIEAQAMKVATIGTDYEVTREVIENNVTGLLFRKRNNKELATLTNTLLANKLLYDNLVKNGYEKAKKRYNSQINILQIVKVYEKLVTK